MAIGVVTEKSKKLTSDLFGISFFWRGQYTNELLFTSLLVE